MLHWHYVGHFDPCDPIDRAQRPFKPKLLSPIPQEVVETALANFKTNILNYVTYYPEGYVLCNWSIAPFKLWDDIHGFAYAFAEVQGAIVMDERFLVEYPPDVRQAQLTRS